MLLRGLGHQNDGDSLAARRGRESESSISVLLRRSVSHSVSFPWCSLSDIPNGASLYPALNWRFFFPSSSVSFWILFLSLPSVLLRLRPGFRLSILPSVSPPRVKLGLFFIIPHVCRTCSESSSDYATLCVPCHRATWNLFREFDGLDIATSAMEKHRIRDDGTKPRSYKKGVEIIFLAHLHISYFSPRFCAILPHNDYLNNQ